jgi:TPR repeat protein
VQRQDLRHPEKIPGEDAFLKGDYATAIPLIMDSFSHGNVRAAFYARIIFENGLDGRASDPAGSQKALDIMVLQFQDIRTLAYRSPGAVRPLYQTALALLYYRGLVPGAGENNLLEARRLASTAAKAGFIPAMNLTAAIACDKNPPKVFGFYRVDSDECYDWTQEAAETGDLLAMTNLSYLYRDGVGTNRDPLMAVNWAHQAASHHPPSRRAQNDMGCYHIIGEALSQDLEEAKVWFTQAATTYPIAQINLERLGQGTPLMESVINY